MRWRLFKIVFTLFSFCNVFAFSQTESEMRVDADKYFTDGKYLEATSLYMRLLSLKPDDYNLNYRYGACLLFNSNKKQDAAKYLSYSIKNPNATPENHYYLGKALQYNYRFGEAVKEFNIYLQNRTKPDVAFPVERDIEMCQNGKRLLTSVTDLIVLDKKEITTDKFFRIYDLKDIGGSLIVTTDFQTKLDKKNNHIPLIHFPQNPSIVFYSSYGENGDQGKDIYFRKKLVDGTWSEATLVLGKVNTQYDEDFPYSNPSGEYLYFSSKGHNSMGGYDVFRSKFDATTGTFGTPENLDFAISSPDDDVLFIVDSLEQNAYFASARQSELGKLHVYKVMMERVPLQMVVLKGSFISEKNPNAKVINIEVSDENGNKIIGNFQSDESGNYTIMLPKGGNYEYVMKLDGVTQEFRTEVKIPISDGFKPYKQVIKHLDENNLEVVKVINLFDEVVEDQQELLAEVIRKRSALDVNVSEFDLNKIASLKADRAVLNEIGLSSLSLNEVIDVLEQQTLKNEQNNSLAATIANNVNNLVVENKTEFLRLEESIKDKVAAANSLNNADDKYKTLKEAENLIKVQNELKKYSNDLIRISDSVNNELSNGLSLEEQNLLGEVSENYKALYNEGKEQEALAELSANKELLQKSLSNTSGNIVQNLVDKSVQLAESNALSQTKIEKYKEEIASLKIEITQLESTQQDAKKKDIPAIENQIASKREEIELIEDEISTLQKTIDSKALEKNTVDKQIDLLQDAISNKSLVTVTRTAANKSIAETDKTNSNTLIAYVQQQVKKLEDEDPTLKDRIVVNSGLNADELYKQYVANNQGISDDPNLNKETKLFKQLTSDRTAIKQLDDRLAEIDQMIAQGKGNEVLVNEKSTLNAFKEKIKSAQNEREAAVATILAKQGVGDKETVINGLSPDYLQNKSFIENNSNLTTSEKNKELDKEDEALLSIIEAELKKVDQALISAPNDQVLLIKQNSLNEIKSNLEKDLESRKNLNNENTNVVADRKSLVKSIDQDYEVNIQNINAKALDEKDKNLALNAADNELIKKIDVEINTTDQKLKSDPNNELLKEKKIELNAIKTEKELDVQKRIESNTALSKSEITQENIIKQLSPTYDETIKTINANTQLSAFEKSKALNASDQSLIDKTDARIKLIDDALIQNPNDALLIQEKIILTELKSDKEEAIESRNQALDDATQKIIASLPDYNLDKDKVNLIQKVSPLYFENLNAVNSSNSYTAKEVAKQFIEVDAKLLEDLKDEKSNVNKQLKNNPESSDLKDELNLIETLEAEALDRLIANNKVKESNEIKANPTEADLEVKRTALLKDVDAKIQSLKSNNNLTEIQKQEAIVEEQKKALNTIDQEIVRLSEKKTLDPMDQKVESELELTSMLKSTIESELSNEEETLQTLKKNDIVATEKDTTENNGKNINNNEISELTEVSIKKDLMPNYEEGKNKIVNNSQLSENEKNEALLNLEREYNEKIKDEKFASKEILDSNPNDEVVIKKMELLTSLEKISDEELKRLKDIQNQEISQENTTNENASAIVNRVAPDYNVNKESLTNSKMEERKKLEQLIKLEERLLNDLETELSELEKQLENNSNDSKLINEKASVVEAIGIHQTEKENYSLRLNDLNKSQVNNIDSKENNSANYEDSEYQDQELAALKGRQMQIQAQLASGELNKKEEKILNQELEKIDSEKNIRINEILTDQFENLVSSTEDLKSELEKSNSGISDEELKVVSSFQESGQEFIDLASKSKSIEENNNLIKQAQIEQLQAKNLLLEALTESKVKEVESGLNTSIFTLEEKKNQLEELEAQSRIVELQLNDLKQEKAAAKKQELELLDEEITNKQIVQKLLNEKISILNEEIELLNSQIVVQTLDENNVNADISFENEIQLAQTKEYFNYYESATAALIEEKKVRDLEAEINVLKDDLKNEIINAVLENRSVNNELLDSKKAELNEKYEQLSIAKKGLKTLQSNAENKLPSASNTALQMQNMVNRGVKPIDVKEIALTELNLPQSGIIIDTTSGKAIAALKNIPLDLKTPSGLVYRVQVGAFSKPIPADLFKEFAPVTTEKIPNTNITRYLAGYFSTSDKATEARDQIRNLGYTDAFIIAYCDGVRVTIAEAKRLEASGECLPKKEDELLMEVAANVVEKLGLDTAAVIVDVDQYDYNKAVGAAKAEAAEKHLGLFYTVQVGVFLHPVNAATVREMSPLMTERLTNGTIRYSVGMFHSSQDAMPTKKLAIEKGVADAFITAYYKGKRISVNEAQKLLELNGTKILEPLETLMPDNDVEEVDSLIQIQNVVSYENQIEVEPIKLNSRIYQIVTKKKFNEFPRDVLNRYNVKGQFYLDEKDSTVKSNLVTEFEDIPGVYYFKEDIDTLIFLDSNELNLAHLKVMCSAEIPGDFMDWLNKINLRKEFEIKEEMIEIRIFGIAENQLIWYEEKLNQFGLTSQYFNQE